MDKEDLVTTLVVKDEKIGKKLNRLYIFHEGRLIGEYERSQDADIERKIEEINAASNLLLETYKQHGQFKVRWDGLHHKKSIRVNDIEVGSVPKKCWRKPSWE